MRRRYARWRGYVWVTLTQLGFCYESDIRHVIALIIRELRKTGFVFSVAEDKLARHEFTNSPEQQETMRAVRVVLHLEPGEGEPRRRRGTESLSDRDPASEEIQADPALQLHQEQLVEELTAALALLSERDRTILYRKLAEGATYRGLAAELGMSVGSLYMRVEDLKVTLALLVTQSRNRNRRV